MSASRSVSSSRVEHLERLADRQVDVVGDRPALDPDGQALGLQPLRRGRRGTAAATRIRLELLLHGPGAFS